MTHVPTLTIAATLASFAILSQTAQARERWPDIPPEVGFHQLRPSAWIPTRCANEPVYNFYHGAIYGEPPAIYLGQTYRPYYRYTAYRVLPRTYYCSER